MCWPSGDNSHLCSEPTSAEACVAAGEDEFTVELRSGTWTQKPQKYHARSLAKLRERYADAAGDATLDALLEATGCLRWMRA